MDLELTGKRALVTGGSRGIGRAIAAALANEGTDTAIAARGEEGLRATAAALAEETGRKMIPIRADTGDAESVRRMVERATGLLGGIDILVNCAAKPGGQSKPPSLCEITEQDFWEDMNVKVMGYLRCAREVAPQMVDRGWGRIINISGLAARGTGSTIGSMRNVAVAAMTKNLADELGPKGVNITVVHPGLTRTEATPGVIESLARQRGVSRNAIESELNAGNSVRRLIDAAEVAHLVAFLASPKAGSINGDAIACGGGVGRAIHY